MWSLVCQAVKFILPVNGIISQQIIDVGLVFRNNIPSSIVPRLTSPLIGDDHMILISASIKPSPVTGC